MNFSWLEDFTALAASGNFSRAATARHMTQPAFSRRVRALEQWLGVELFDRGCQPVRLTEAGHWFLRTARELQLQVERLPAEARAVAQAGATTLRFAATHALSFTFVPRWLHGMEARAPVGPVQLVSDVQQRCEELLLLGQVQFLLCHGHRQVRGPLDEAGCSTLVVGSDRLIPVSAPDPRGRPLHRVAPDGSCASAAPLGYSSESGLGRILRELRPARGSHARAARPLTAHLASVLRSMALDGRGPAWLPGLLVDDDLAAGRLVRAGAPEDSIELELRLVRSPAPLGTAADAFWSAARRVAADTGARA